MATTSAPLETTTKFTQPQLTPEAHSLMNQLTGSIQNLPKFDFNQYLTQAFQGPYFQNVSSGLLGALEPGFRQQRQNLQDQFRSANVMPSSAYAMGMSNLAGQQGLQRNQI